MLILNIEWSKTLCEMLGCIKDKEINTPKGTPRNEDIPVYLKGKNLHEFMVHHVGIYKRNCELVSFSKWMC